MLTLLLGSGLPIRKAVFLAKIVHCKTTNISLHYSSEKVLKIAFIPTKKCNKLHFS